MAKHNFPNHTGGNSHQRAIERAKGNIQSPTKPPEQPAPAVPMPVSRSWKRALFRFALRWRTKTRLLLHRPAQNNTVTWIPRIAGLSFVVGGWALMEVSYIGGIVCVYFGLLFCAAECVIDSALNRYPFWRMCAVAAVILFAFWFTKDIVLIKAPIEFESYAMRNGEHPPGTVIAGIKWDSHLTDLRVWIKNTSPYDYKDMDIDVQPDKWNYKAAIFQENTGCRLIPSGSTDEVSVARAAKSGVITPRAHFEEGGVEATDSSGNIYEPFVRKGGYRLSCSKFSAHSSIEIVFALASLNEKVASQIAPSFHNLSDKYQINAAALKGVQNNFDLLANRPSTSTVQISGNYALKTKPFSLSRRISAGDGN